MDIWVVHLLNGITFGMLLFLLASGLSLVLGVMGILNLAHGTLYMLGAYVGLTLISYVGNFWLAALLSGIGIGLFGLVLERLFLSRLHRQINEQVLLTLGLVYILGNAVLWVWGPFPKLGTVPSILDVSMHIGDLSFPVYRFVIIVIGLAIAAGLWLFQEKTRSGAIIRAGMDDKQMTMGLGINYGLVSTAIFFLGAFIAGLAGFLGSPILGAEPGMSFPIILLAMIVVVVGGMGTVQGTLLGSIVIGLLDTLGKAFFPDFALFTIYLVFIIILLVRPTGLLAGRKI